MVRPHLEDDRRSESALSQSFFNSLPLPPCPTQGKKSIIPFESLKKGGKEKKLRKKKSRESTPTNHFLFSFRGG